MLKNSWMLLRQCVWAKTKVSAHFNVSIHTSGEKDTYIMMQQANNTEQIFDARSLCRKFPGRMIAKVIKFQQWQWLATPPTTVTYGKWSHWLLTWSESTGVLLYHNGKAH